MLLLWSSPANNILYFCHFFKMITVKSLLTLPYEITYSSYSSQYLRRCSGYKKAYVVEWPIITLILFPGSKLQQLLNLPNQISIKGSTSKAFPSPIKRHNKKSLSGHSAIWKIRGEATNDWIVKFNRKPFTCFLL